MSGKNKLTCPDCEVGLKLVLLSDLVGEVKAGGAGVSLAAATAVFDHFNFWVCPHCGRTLLYAGPQAQAKAAGREAGPGGGILGLE